MIYPSFKRNCTIMSFLAKKSHSYNFYSSESKLSKNLLNVNSTMNNMRFSLSNDFILKYKDKPVEFGFNGLGELVYKRTYSRQKEEGTNEEWYETVKRVVEGAFTMKLSHLMNLNHQFDYLEVNKDAEQMFDLIFNFKFLPPGRGLWAMGTKITESKGLFAALNNCAFVTTKPESDNIYSIVKPYLFLMDCSMLGIGVGFDTKATIAAVKVKKPSKETFTYQIEDSREGWVNSIGLLLNSFFGGDKLPIFDYSLIRPAGIPLKTFGGVSCGFQVLKELHNDISNTLIKFLGENDEKLITSRIITDLMNLIGRAVIAGNIRRSAEIALGKYDDEDFINLKNYSVNPERQGYGWVSNNSIYAELGMDYSKFTNLVAENGEPGFLWLDNMKKYSRMIDQIDNKDIKAEGGNPCLEQTLESYEMCCLVETFPNKHNNIEEFKNTLKYAFMYAKIVTLGMTNWDVTNQIITKNRRIGVSMTGITQFISKNGLENLRRFCVEGYEFLRNYDKVLSHKLKINESIKLTSIKPSGTVSLLGGATPGMHFPLSRFYIRRVRLKKESPLVNELIKKGYHVENDVFQSDTTVVVEFPVDVGKGVKTISESNLWEQLSLAAFLQKYWADNQVSSTVTFKKCETSSLNSALDYFQYQLKGISFLPASEETSPYPQMPYEEITETVYLEKLSKIKFGKFESQLKNDQLERESDKYCDGGKCEI